MGRIKEGKGDGGVLYRRMWTVAQCKSACLVWDACIHSEVLALPPLIYSASVVF